ncbi:aliphatic sulfonate ABC transporter substrate-binding protein [Hyphomicrobium sp.]|jgi:sulfonate transport system substrate-binding protein|uniref:aliphatic sulfonate ABC transporter substrate-binding protein n=1 Tax=Hyphomicrobium sp. TaxID=82 RepID=UPI002B653E21|nr:aliphatic sulfonate ABC transporter substrate-binding protein [Hyphomicrobium sp.]HVZ03972.1 aliphatic sulfonate ABC transporter substrate-binding protein [Hyphomicrobium sp.]
MNRRQISLGIMGFCAIGLGAAVTAHADNKQTTVRIGYQKSSTLIAILKANGELEKDLAKLGVSVSWSEFQNGLPVLEALNVGAIDISGDVADTVPVFAQAAGANLTYIASEAPSPTAQALLVPATSPIKSVSELKGKKIAVTKGAGSHYLLIAALARDGLDFKDITPAYLPPADGRAAFEKGAVDAWVTWDPFVSAAIRQSKARLLTDGTNLASYNRYYLASAKFAAARPDVLRVVFDKLKETGVWVKKNPDAAVKILAPVWHLDPEIIAKANSHRSYDVREVTQANLVEEQKIADTFFAQKLLPRAIKTTESRIWSPSKQAAAN